MSKVLGIPGNTGKIAGILMRKIPEKINFEADIVDEIQAYKRDKAK